MNEIDFDTWLRNAYVGRNGVGLDQRTRASQLSHARRIERFEGDLDAHYDGDGMTKLLDRLSYSLGDWRRGTPPRHKIPIDGNAYNVTASLRTAASLYQQFRRRGSGAASLSRPSMPRQPTVMQATRRRSSVPGQHAWPAWEQPSEAAVLALARTVTPLVRFLDPTIVSALVADNARHREEWRAALAQRGINPAAYLWDRSATAFPGIRRYAGTAELRRFQETRGKGIAGALRLDDNTCPKHVWSFALRGRPFQQFGPDGYELAHLIDHKEYKNRGAEELIGPVADYFGPEGLPGLFTSAANSAFVPKTFLRPTDFSPLLRNLLQRRAQALYGGFCRLLPEGLRIRDAASPAWELSAFPWADPVGSTAFMQRFLDFRCEEMNRLLAANETFETERDIADARQALAEAETEEGTTSLADLRAELGL